MSAVGSPSVMRMMRNLPLLASVVAQHLARGPLHATLIGLRLLPKPLAAALGRLLAVPRTAHLGALAHAAAGHRERALLTLTCDVPHTERAARRRIRTAVALDAPSQARQVLRDTGVVDPYLDALIAESAGQLTQAIELAASNSRAARVRRRTESRLASFAEQPLVPAPPAPAQPKSGTVLHLVTNALPETTAGYTIRTQGIAHAQKQAGLEPHVVTRLGFPVTTGRLSAATKEDVHGVQYHRLLPRRLLPMHEDRRLALDAELTGELVDRLRPSLLHAHSKHTNAQVAIAVAARRDLPVVYEVRGFLEETWHSRGHAADSDVYVWAQRAETRCMSRADAVVTISETMKAQIVGRGVDASNILVVPNAVDPVFLETPPEAGPLRESLGIRPDDVVLGLVSTLNHYEGVTTLIEAGALLRARGAPIRVLIVGEGPAAATARKRAAELGLDDYVHLTGRVPFSDVRLHHAAIDVFCVPRVDVPVTRLVPPLKPVEAMATGRPVVASDLPPLRETVIEGLTGRLAVAGEPESWAQQLEPLVYDPAVRSRLGANAREWVGRNRTWDRAAVEYSALYRRLGAL